MLANGLLISCMHIRQPFRTGQFLDLQLAGIVTLINFELWLIFSVDSVSGIECPADFESASQKLSLICRCRSSRPRSPPRRCRSNDWPALSMAGSTCNWIQMQRPVSRIMPEFCGRSGPNGFQSCQQLQWGQWARRMAVIGPAAGSCLPADPDGKVANVIPLATTTKATGEGIGNEFANDENSLLLSAAFRQIMDTMIRRKSIRRACPIHKCVMK